MVCSTYGRSGFDYNHVYWANDIDFVIQFRVYQEYCHRLFVGWNNVEVFAAALACRDGVSASVTALWSCYKPKSLLYMPSPQVLS